MANPTTNKPTTPEWDSTANPNLQFLCAFKESTGAPIDLVGNVPARQYAGYGGYLTGLTPSVQSASFGDVTSQPVRRCGPGTSSLIWPNRGYTTAASTATPKTFAITFRHNYPTGRNAAVAGTVSLFGSGTDGNGSGILLSITTEGIVTLLLRRGGSNSPALLGGSTLTAGTWYSVFVTLGSATARLSNYYDHASQSLGTQSGLTESSYFWQSSAPHIFLLNPLSGSSYESPEIEVYAACVANETWDSGTNTRFSEWYTDPCAWARGTYTPSASTLVAGVASFNIETTSGITVTCSRPTGGSSSGAYTYQWHRSQLGYGFTTGVGTAISGATGRVYTDTDTSPGDTWYYRCVQSDGSASVTTGTVEGFRPRGHIRSGLIGDSLMTAGSNAPHGRSVEAVRSKWRHSWMNRAIGSRFAGTATNTVAGQSYKPGHWTIQPTANMTAGTFTLTWRGQTTSAIAYNASIATVQTAIRALSTVGGTNATVFGSTTMSSTNPFGVLFSGAALSGGAVSGDVLSVDTSGITGGPLTVWSEYRNAAISFANSWMGIDEIDIHLGANDAGLLISSSETFASDLLYLTNSLLAEGFSAVRLHTPPARWQGASDAVSELLRQYESAVDGICNGTTIRRGAALRNWTTFGDQQMDGLHFGPTGYYAIGVDQFSAIRDDLDPIVLPESTDPGIGNVRSGTDYMIDDVPLEGTLVVPSLADTKTGVAGDGGTGTYDGSDRWTDPGIANVESGVTYKANSTTNNRTGTFAVPDPGDVESGVTYGSAAEFTGTLIVGGGGTYTDPGIANVKTGVGYTYNDTPLTGTYDGSDRHTDPGVSNVEAGVTYKSNSTTSNRTGTFIVPTEAQVEEGVTFGAASEFTGTLAVGGGEFPTASEIATASAIAVRNNLATELGRIDANVSSRMATFTYTAPPTTGAIAAAVDAVVSDDVATILVAIGTRAPSGTALSNAVWTDDKADNLDVAISTRSTYAGGAVTVSDKTGFKLASDGLDSISQTMTGVPDTFVKKLLWVFHEKWRATRNKTTGAKTVYGSNGSVATTQATTDTDTQQTISAGT